MGREAERSHELYELGLAYIRTAIRASLAEVDAEMAVAGILHPSWSRRFPPPDTVAVSVMPARAPVVTVEFTGRELQECWRGVESAEVCRKVRSFALEYQRLLAESSRSLRRQPEAVAPRHSL